MIVVFLEIVNLTTTSRDAMHNHSCSYSLVGLPGRSTTSIIPLSLKCSSNNIARYPSHKACESKKPNTESTTFVTVTPPISCREHSCYVTCVGTYSRNGTLRTLGQF